MPSYTQYKRQVVLDDDNDIESWITVKGNHIPIKKGQSKEEAVKSFIEHQVGKNDTPQGVKWTPTNKKGEGTGNKKSEGTPKYNIQHGAKISDIESMINAHADKKAYKSWEEEEQFVAEKLKEEGIYAYGNQIKEAMKNVYGEEYIEGKKDYTIAHKDNSGNVTVIAEVSHHDISEPEEKKERKYPELKEGQVVLYRDIDDNYAVIDPDGAYTFYKNGVKGAQNRSLKRQEGAIQELGSIGYSAGKELNPDKPKDIMEWKFNDVMQLPVSDPRVHKYIAKNNGLKESTVSTIAEGFGSTEDLYFEIDRISDRKGYGWDKIKNSGDSADTKKRWSGKWKK